MQKNPIIAFLLGFIPGIGLLYLRKTLRGVIYLGAEIGLVLLSLLLAANWEHDLAFLCVFIGILLYIVNLVDTAITASKLYGGPDKENLQPKNPSEESERFFTIILSFIPGVGHFQLGLMNRGMTILASFLGLGVMVFFVAVLTHREEFLIFLAILPVIWFYGFFDAMQQLNKKSRGEVLVDRSLLEDFEMRREDGKKSKSIATFLSMFPGAGHLYLGYQRRGIQLMAAFLFSIYILDILRLGIFLFLIPIIWFYSFFDGLQRATKHGEESMEDKPIIEYLINQQKWVGIGLILLGLYYMTTNIIIPAVSPMLYTMIDIDLRYWFDRYFQTAIVSILFIAGGIKLLKGKKEKKVEQV
ncbi:hypothetical protein SM124_18045 [Bacillus sp. 31A1R]|uniref:Multi-TM2 domain-containing protein n=1 Tax=Robertmurraya mangrovi TaxID=3098077 RepID=A0ABU5J2N6_9BACI|nr:hypothetical protein [Bacillus sp. 31A1R]MDZ5473621.1 hypothetical protein [Bacillus sp. 31A1R]